MPGEIIPLLHVGYVATPLTGEQDLPAAAAFQIVDSVADQHIAADQLFPGGDDDLIPGQSSISTRIVIG